MQLVTERLIIKPLSVEELRKYVLEDFVLEKFWQLTLHTRNVSARIKNNISNNIIPHLIDTNKNPNYYTFWTIINHELKTMVGDICFKGEPDKNGALEIGYGTYKDFEGNGFITEAVAGLVNWAVVQKNVSIIVAQTDPNNIGSIRVLEKNNFVAVEKKETNIIWHFSKT